MSTRTILTAVVASLLAAALLAAQPKGPPEKPDPNPRPLSSDPSVKLDYDIVYVRAPRPRGGGQNIRWADVLHSVNPEPGAELMLLHPDGREEVLVPVAPDEAIADPFVSFDGEWVYYAKFFKCLRTHLPEYGGSDVYKIHVPTRQVVRLTHQEYTPNLPAEARPGTPVPVYNMGPCPVPGGKVAFTSTRNGFTPPKGRGMTSQLFLMDDDGGNVECTGHLNVAGALHPVILTDGRIMFSSFEVQGSQRMENIWGVWAMNPDGTNWGPLLSAYRSNSFHFQTQLSDGSIVVQEYYHGQAFGTYHKFAVPPPGGSPPFGPGRRADPRNPPLPPSGRQPFSPAGLVSLTPFAPSEDIQAPPADPRDPNSPRVGKVIHPCGAPDNHLLTVWSPGPVKPEGPAKGAVDAGIYLLKGGRPIDTPGQLLCVKNDPNYNEQWPRPLVPYKRIYGIDRPPGLVHKNDGTRHPQLPEGTPFGLVGTASLYKRETYHDGTVFPGEVTARYAGGQDPWQGIDSFYWGNGKYSTFDYVAHEGGFLQGGDVGRYTNSDIHAVRILAMEHASAATGRRFFNYAQERLHILGEVPVRKFERGASGQPLDPDSNPDTSFLVKIPADVPFTFQTLDRDGLVLNMAQTWHQLRPGEVRTNCGGCHAHSQKPTDFRLTAAAGPDYPVWDLTRQTPLLTTKAHDQSGKQWDAKDETGVRFDGRPVKHVEYYRDVKPILDRSCVACHTQEWAKPAGGLVLDDDATRTFQTYPYDKVGLTAPGTYVRLAADANARYSPKPLHKHWGAFNASRYVRKFQARRSLLVWKVYGRRTDGWTNDDFPTETTPGDPNTLRLKGRPVPPTIDNRLIADLDYTGSAMPPPAAVAGGYAGPDGQTIKVPPLTDEDRRTIARWIDLGCPIDGDYDPKHPEKRGRGWVGDDTRPTLTVTYPEAGPSRPLTRLLVGMHDYDSGLDLASFTVTADFPLAGREPGQNLAAGFQALPGGRWELALPVPLTDLPRGQLTVSVQDRQGNRSRIERRFSIPRR
jgi:hypothetical protein